MNYNKSGLQMCFNYDELLLLRLHISNDCKNLINKLDCAIKDYEEIQHLNNQKIFSESKRDLENLQNIFTLISKVNENGVFLEEEIEYINKQLNEKL